MKSSRTVQSIDSFTVLNSVLNADNCEVTNGWADWQSTLVKRAHIIFYFKLHPSCCVVTALKGQKECMSLLLQKIPVRNLAVFWDYQLGGTKMGMIS